MEVIMVFRRMEELTRGEIAHLLQIICPYAELLYLEKKSEPNYIKVYYRMPFDRTNKERCVEFLPDEVILEDEKEASPEQMYDYEQFMIARGFSEYWRGNPYIV